jgi:hypothetical protein
MRIIITNHFLCKGFAFDVAHFYPSHVITKGGSRFYANQWRVAGEGEEGERLNPDMELSNPSGLRGIQLTLM